MLTRSEPRDLLREIRTRIESAGSHADFNVPRALAQTRRRASSPSFLPALHTTEKAVNDMLTGVRTQDGPEAIGDAVEVHGL